MARGTLRKLWEANPDALESLKAWYHEARRAAWSSPHEVKRMYRPASAIGNNRIVFIISGNKYRLIVKFNYDSDIGYIRFIGTHAEYDNIDVENV